MIDPQPVVLEGHGVRLEPIEPSHSDALQAAAADGEVWKTSWYTAVADLAPGKGNAYVDATLKGQQEGHMLRWAVRELGAGAIIGSTGFHDIARAIDRVEVGYTFYAGRWQGTHVNTACKLLLLGHAFDALGCRVVGLRVDNLNERSQKAVEALGAKKDGVIRHFQARLDGSVRDTHMYGIIAAEWPDVNRRLEARLRQRLSR